MPEMTGARGHTEIQSGPQRRREGTREAGPQHGMCEEGQQTEVRRQDRFGSMKVGTRCAAGPYSRKAAATPETSRGCPTGLGNLLTPQCLQGSSEVMNHGLLVSRLEQMQERTNQDRNETPGCEKVSKAG